MQRKEIQATDKIVKKPAPGPGNFVPEATPALPSFCGYPSLEKLHLIPASTVPRAPRETLRLDELEMLEAEIVKQGFVGTPDEQVSRLAQYALADFHLIRWRQQRRALTAAENSDAPRRKLICLVDVLPYLLARAAEALLRLEEEAHEGTLLISRGGLPAFAPHFVANSRAQAAIL